MVLTMKMQTRSPCASIAKAVLKKRAQKAGLKNNAANVEERCRKNGGYGKAVCSIHEAPKGGIEKSPAYRKLLTRVEVDENGCPPKPEDRDGAPLKGGFPLDKYPPNVIVDGLRASWLPDDWAQAIKNTGPGGTYLGWMSPQGKFFYHRAGYPSAIEETIGRKLTFMDGLNGQMRSARKIVKPGADKAFLSSCLITTERKFIAPASEFHFGVVSARRATNESGQHDIMVIEGHFKQVGIKPTWYVDEASLADYKKMGVNAKVGGKLTPARNMVLDDAKKEKKVAVEVSDDISKWIYYDVAKQDFRGETDFAKANKALLGAKKHIVSPLAAAQFMLAKMRSDPAKPHLGGVFPTANAAMTLGGEEFSKQHFILGDFFVAEPESPCRFDTTMTLKEDYDYTCSHIKTHGSVLRCNRMFLQVKHATNEGGAVAVRDSAGSKERENIAILQKKWPGAFRMNNKRKQKGAEVIMSWKHYGQDRKEKSKKISSKVIKHILKDNTSKIKAKCVPSTYPDNAIVNYLSEKQSKVAYINQRCAGFHNRKVADCIGTKFKDASGNERIYNRSDLKYDIEGGRLKLTKTSRRS